MSLLHVSCYAVQRFHPPVSAICNLFVPSQSAQLIALSPSPPPPPGSRYPPTLHCLQLDKCSRPPCPLAPTQGCCLNLQMSQRLTYQDPAAPLHPLPVLLAALNITVHCCLIVVSVDTVGCQVLYLLLAISALPQRYMCFYKFCIL